jgi:hypothetical protein
MQIRRFDISALLGRILLKRERQVSIEGTLFKAVESRPYGWRMYVK